MTLARDDLHALATSVYGSEWQTALAKERGLAIRSVQRWAKEGIAKPETAVALRAYLLSRRIVDLPPPLSDDDDERDDSAHTVMPVVLEDILEAGRAVGWHDAELLAATMSYVIDRMIEGAGPPATIETLRQAIGEVQKQLAS